MNYDDFINELRDLSDEAKGLLNAGITHDFPPFRKWRHNVSSLIAEIDNRGYEINCNIDNRLFQVASYGHVSKGEEKDTFNRDLEDTLNEIEVIIDRYDKYGDPQIVELPIEAGTEDLGKRVFVVHGHNEEVKQSVARFLEQLELEPIILSEQPNEGKTIIEKFEHNADVGFAVILLTPDDMGYPDQKPNEVKARARQNVILELGYFVGRLSRARVCALVVGDIELPSDIHGVIYIQYDENDGWKMRLAGEIKQAGLEVDLNLAVKTR